VHSEQTGCVSGLCERPYAGRKPEDMGANAAGLLTQGFEQKEQS